MLFKRYLGLAAGILLFISILVIRFAYTNAEIEGHFRQERVDAGVQGAILTSTAPIPPEPTTTPASASSTTPSGNSTIDTNILIGPVPPPADNTPAPAPAPTTDPAPSAAPATPSSTMVNPRSSPFTVLAAYRASDGMRIENTALDPIQTAIVPPAPATQPPAGTNAPVATGTNAAPAAPTGPLRAVPVEASVIVLGYHQFVAPGVSSKNVYVMKQDVFESEMKYLHDYGYHVVPLSDVVRFIKHEIGLPPNSVAITIDDGFKSAIVYAAPVLKKYGYPWTFFVYPQFITPTENKGAASWPDLLALQADGVDIECHSMTHPFPGLTHKNQTWKGSKHLLSTEEYEEFLTNETAGAKTLLEQKMGKPILYFAYPYGDWNKEVQAKCIAAGYDALFTVAGNPVHGTTDKDNVGRYIITQVEEKDFPSYLRQGALGLGDVDPAPGTTITNPRPVITAVLGYTGNIDPKSIETSVRDFGLVRHDFDPKTTTVRLYLPRDLVQATNLVTIRVKDADTGQTMVANWHFNYAPPGGALETHPPLGTESNSTPATAPAASPKPAPAAKPAPAPAPKATSSARASTKPAASTATARSAGTKP